MVYLNFQPYRFVRWVRLFYVRNVVILDKYVKNIKISQNLKPD